MSIIGIEEGKGKGHKNIFNKIGEESFSNPKERIVYQGRRSSKNIKSTGPEEKVYTAHNNQTTKHIEQRKFKTVRKK